MAHLHTMQKKGLLNLPGATYATKKLTEDLLLRDAEKHHCYFNTAGFHNHLSHQCVASLLSCSTKTKPNHLGMCAVCVADIAMPLQL